ncbi:hypothetical protein AGIG_G3360 [Arapaima gigas]
MELHFTLVCPWKRSWPANGTHTSPKAGWLRQCGCKPHHLSNWAAAPIQWILSLVVLCHPPPPGCIQRQAVLFHTLPCYISSAPSRRHVLYVSYRLVGQVNTSDVPLCTPAATGGPGNGGGESGEGASEESGSARRLVARADCGNSRASRVEMNKGPQMTGDCDRQSVSLAGSCISWCSEGLPSDWLLG